MPTWQDIIEPYRRDNRVPFAITAICALLFLVAVWQLLNGFKNNAVKKSMVPTAHIQVLPVIADLHLFGAYSGVNTALPVTQLQLTLLGTIVMVDSPSFSHAIISAASSPAKVYQVGDMLPGNVKITQINRDSVVLNQNGSLQQLLLPIEKLTADQTGQ